MGYLRHRAVPLQRLCLYHRQSMRTMLMWIAFDGTDFHGFQAQPGLRTVQSELEAALMRVLRHPVLVVSSGRTDAGVHAASMGISFATERSLAPDKLLHALVSRLPADLGILGLQEVQPDFHARRDAICKLYQYRIYASRTRPVAEFVQRYVYHCWRELDVDAMNHAAERFHGTHDFAAFAGAGCSRESTVRTVQHCNVERHFNEVRMNVIGDGFLYQQVRIMTGTLLEVGLGRWSPDDVTRIIEDRDRKRAGSTAPPQGLCLRWVRYPGERLRPPAESS